MLHVLLLLLKILGMLLLLLIGLVLLVLLTPIQYSFELEKEEQTEPKFMVKITWLFWLFYFKTSYIEKVFDYRIRILGHQIAGNQPEFLERQKERQKKKAQREKAKKGRKKNKEDREKQQEEKSGKTNKKKPEEAEKNTQVMVTEKKLAVKKAPEEDILQSNISTDIPQSMSAEAPVEGRSRSIDAVSKEQSVDVSESKEKDSGDNKNSKGKKENKEKKQKKQKKESPFKKLKGRIKSLKETKSNLDKLPWREWLELGKDILIRFFKHVLPRKLEGSIAFGLSDPEYTGYVTGLAAIFYPKYGEYFSLYPDFEGKMFEAKCKGKGRIRPGYMLVLVVSILKEKSVRTMIKNIILG